MAFPTTDRDPIMRFMSDKTLLKMAAKGEATAMRELGIRKNPKYLAIIREAFIEVTGEDPATW